ncbi:hypothetical protein [Streptomyces sp. CA-111067]|uniref:hypothetical protein n=1 Tax=Streptomyces sp. CA-111067 TaxID=3240046 RepID=UPI003D98C60F
MRIGALVGVMVLLGGCGVIGGSGGHKGASGPAPKPLEVIDQMRPDVTAAVRAAMPGRELLEPSYDRENCKASRWADTASSGKIIEIEIAGADGGASDRRSVAEIIAVMAKTLESRGWKLNADRYPPTETTKELTKPDIHGVVHLDGSRIDLGKGRSFPTVNGTMLSDCLPNPNK